MLSLSLQLLFPALCINVSGKIKTGDYEQYLPWLLGLILFIVIVSKVPRQVHNLARGCCSH
jgi:hypothetical protein